MSNNPNKNLKLHIKNIQIADAINLKGLKAKLSKKKGTEEEGSAKEPVAKKTESAPPPSPQAAKAPKKAATPTAAQVAPVEVAPPVRAAEPTHRPAVPPKEPLGPVFPTTRAATTRAEVGTRPPERERPREYPREQGREYPRGVSGGAPRMGPRGGPGEGPRGVPGGPPGAYRREERGGHPPVSGERHPRPHMRDVRPAFREGGRPRGEERPRPFMRPQQFGPGRPPLSPPHGPRPPRPPLGGERPSERPPERFDRKSERRGGLEAELEASFKRSKAKVKETREVRPARKMETKTFDARHRHGLQSGEEEHEVWRKRRMPKMGALATEQEVVRPVHITIRLPISVKELAASMKLKASEVIAKLFLQGIVVTLNDLLTDDTTVQLLGQEFGCEIRIDTTQEERIRITDKSIRAEISAEGADMLLIRPPVVTFMGHVDHGKTSLIDAIRKSNRAQQEVGAITQHIGAFRCETGHGPITILDTPGHEAFTQMRERGTGVTDIVVLVIAGDEGIMQQTLEAINQARAAKVAIVVAINKCDKPAFDLDMVYRQLAEQDLLPEAWGGQTVTISCSATTGKGVVELVEMLALQAEVLELKANPQSRARGTVIESEMHKGLGAVATVLVQNGTLRSQDSIVFAFHSGRIKAMYDENGVELSEAGPSTPVLITGLSGLPEAGEEFIVVKNEKEARLIAKMRQEEARETHFQARKRASFETMMEKAQDTQVKKVLNVILRADVQGSLEALKKALEKITSQKIRLEVVSFGVGEVSESDIDLAAASKSVIIGFHTQVQPHAESMIKEKSVTVRLHDIIYHAVDDVRSLMKGMLDKVAEESDKGKAEVKAIFRSSQLGVIAGCQVTDGAISRNSQIRLVRGGTVLWKGGIQSLKRHKEDVREVMRGMECGILLQGFSEVQEGDILEAFEVIYLPQEL